MSNLGNKEIMAENISRLMELKGIDRNKLSDDLSISYTTISDWIKAKTYPRIDKIEMMANYFNVSKSDLVEKYNPSEKTKKDILSIYNLLDQKRQSYVYKVAENQLNEQYSNIIHLESYQDVPLTSKVSAGTGILDLDPFNVETIEFYGKVPDSYDLAFQVDGDSMEPLFENGEIVFVKKTEELINGQIAVVQINEEAFIKKVYVEDNDIRLVSLNKHYEDILTTAKDDIRVIGKVVF